MARTKGIASKQEARVKNRADNVSALQLKALCEQMNEISDFYTLNPLLSIRLLILNIC